MALPRFTLAQVVGAEHVRTQAPFRRPLPAWSGAWVALPAHSEDWFNHRGRWALYVTVRVASFAVAVGVDVRPFYPGGDATTRGLALFGALDAAGVADAVAATCEAIGPEAAREAARHILADPSLAAEQWYAAQVPR